MVNKCIKKETLAKLFPIGTDRTFVNRVLVKAGGAKESLTKPEKNQYSYFYKPRHWSNWFFPHTWNVAITYDEKGKVIKVTVPGGPSPGESVYDFYRDCKIDIHYGRRWEREKDVPTFRGATYNYIPNTWDLLRNRIKNALSDW